MDLRKWSRGDASTTKRGSSVPMTSATRRTCISLHGTSERDVRTVRETERERESPACRPARSTDILVERFIEPVCRMQKSIFLLTVTPSRRETGRKEKKKEEEKKASKGEEDVCGPIASFGRVQETSGPSESAASRIRGSHRDEVFREKHHLLAAGEDDYSPRACLSLCLLLVLGSAFPANLPPSSRGGGCSLFGLFFRL